MVGGLVMTSSIYPGGQARTRRAPFNGRVMLSVNEHTASAGKMISASAEKNNLATVVGTKTPGVY
jgi:C-terminal processing protease CtpA/Prc